MKMGQPTVDVVVLFFSVGIVTGGRNAHLCCDAYHVHLSVLPHGQYSYSGHVINLPQDVVSFASILPRLPSQLDVVVVKKEGSSHTHQDFRVRRAVVQRALVWLITNNVLLTMCTLMRMPLHNCLRMDIFHI